MTRVAMVIAVVAIAIASTAVADERERDDDFVDVSKVVPDVVLDIRYATTDNFMHEKVYEHAVCKLRRKVATALAVAAKRLREHDRRLILWDCYRPASAQKVLWRHNPDARYVANPKVGSVHSRGAAVDIGIVDKDGKAVPLPTPYDASSRESWRDHALVGDKGREARKLDAAMTDAGFVGIRTEWWHYDFKSAGVFPLADEPL